MAERAGWMPVRGEERAAALWSAGLFMSALGSYYMLRPLREEAGVAGGVDGLPWLFTATFVVMLAAVPLYSWLVARLGRRVFVPLVYRLCAAVLLGFFAWFSLAGDAGRVWAARAFFVWVTVHGLMVASVFWELMADVWRKDQGVRVFGLIAAGGSAGALVGPLLTALLAPRIGTEPLLLIAALCLEGAVLCRRRLGRALPTGPESHDSTSMSEEDAAVGGGALAAFTLIARSPRLLGLAGYVVLLTLTSTFAYMEQARIVKAALADPAARTAMFARIDLVISAISMVMQGLAVGRIVPRLGVGPTLAVLPLLTLCGFLALAASPTLAVLVGFQIVRRAADFSLAKPAREVLFTLEGREAKYKAKHLIDTALYRGGDLVSAWAFRGLAALGLGTAALCGVGALLCLPWVGLAWMLGKTGEKGQVEGGRSDQPPANT